MLTRSTLTLDPVIYIPGPYNTLLNLVNLTTLPTLPASPYPPNDLIIGHSRTQTREKTGILIVGFGLAAWAREL